MAPIYPRRAQSRGIEGYCIVEYTVNREGNTQDLVIVECDPEGYFESASIRAAEKFKYKPGTVDGNAVDVPGIRNQFNYELQN